jgi:hypothetical protein
MRKVLEKMKTHVSCSITFLLKSGSLWERGKIFSSPTGHRWLWRMRIARWIPKATDTHTPHVLSHCKNSCTHVPYCYVIRTLLDLFEVTYEDAHRHVQAVQQIYCPLRGLSVEDVKTTLLSNVGDFTSRHGVTFQKTLVFLPLRTPCPPVWRLNGSPVYVTCPVLGLQVGGEDLKA